MRPYLLFWLLALIQVLPAQTFTEVSPAQSFDGVYLSYIAFSDVDGDNDQDVLITGVKESIGNERIAKLYINDGGGNFTEMVGTPFEGVVLGSVAFADVDGDNDLDLLITGEKDVPTFERIAKLYINDGTGNFTPKAATPFEGVWDSSIAFSDVDGDNDQDVVITGETNLARRIAKLYLNDGIGNFSEKTGLTLEGVKNGSISFADVDGDTDQDLLITGQNGVAERIAKLYTNDGMGNFSEMTNTPFEGVWMSSVAFSDVDGDNDHDVLITGRSGSPNFENSAKIYINNGLGAFTEKTGTPFDSIGESSIAFSDVDGDNDQDVLITGESDFYFEPIAKLYINDGMGNFSEIAGTPFDGVRDGSVAFSDVDGDNDPDVLITGVNSSFETIAKLYMNGRTTSSNRGTREKGITVSPNPAPGVFTLYSPQAAIESIALYDLTGRALSAEVSLDRHEAQVRSDYRGLVVVKVQTQRGSWVGKVRME